MIKEYITELQSIENEIKRLSSELRKLQKQKSNIKFHITEYLQNSDNKGVKYKGMSFVLKEGQGRIRKKKSEKILDCNTILNNHGIQDPTLGKNMLEAMRGTIAEKTTLEVKKLSK